MTEKTLASIRQHIYNHLIKLPMSFFSARRVGELNSRISSDISLLQDTLTYTLADLISQIIVIIGGITLMAISSFQLTLFTLAIVPAISLLAFFSGRAIRRYSKKAQAFVAESNTIVEETLQGIQNVKAFTNEAFESDRYRAKTEEVARMGIKGVNTRLPVSFIVLGFFISMAAGDMEGGNNDRQRTDGGGTAVFIRYLLGVHRGKYCRYGRCLHTAAEDTRSIGETVAPA
ncbi:MAG: ABC transporter transmembrane domain-containing protein [Marinilabiliales bacterium]|nr:ABC transporter transmembrane domain-containing protein [Marinilabiliales bacterium]